MVTHARRPAAVLPLEPPFAGRQPQIAVDAAEAQAVPLSAELRKAGFYVELGYNGNIKKRFKKADSANAAAAIIFGEDELAGNIIKIKDFDSGKEEEVGIQSLLDRLAGYK